MRVLRSTLTFCFGLLLLFTLLTYQLPQQQGDAPVEQKRMLATLSMEAFISAGEGLFNGQGSCTLCHNELGRAPNLLTMDVGAVAAARLADRRYQGKAGSVEDYLRESMLDPSAFVVAGFGRKGTNDERSPMPSVDKAPIGLRPIEIDAIIAFLQAKDGHEVSVALPSETVDERAEETATATMAEAVIQKYGCLLCHALLGGESTVGPTLDFIGVRQSADQIRQSIVDPAAQIVAGYPAGVMPDDFAQRMSAEELEMIVSFLSGQTGSPPVGEPEVGAGSR